MTMTANPPIGGQWPGVTMRQPGRDAAVSTRRYGQSGLTTALTTSARFVGHFALALVEVGVLGADTDH